MNRPLNITLEYCIWNLVYSPSFNRELEEKRVPESEFVFNLIETLRNKSLPGVGDFTKIQHARMTQGQISSVRVSDDNIFRLILNKKLNLFDKNYHLMRVFMFDEADPTGKIRHYKTVGVNGDAKVSDVIALSVKKFKILEVSCWSFTLCSFFKNRGFLIPLTYPLETLRAEDEFITDILQMGHGSAQDIDFILRKTWSGLGVAPSSDSSQIKESDEIKGLLHERAPSFLRDGTSAIHGSSDDMNSINGSGSNTFRLDKDATSPFVPKSVAAARPPSAQTPTGLSSPSVAAQFSVIALDGAQRAVSSDSSIPSASDFAFPQLHSAIIDDGTTGSLNTLDNTGGSKRSSIVRKPVSASSGSLDGNVSSLHVIGSAGTAREREKLDPPKHSEVTGVGSLSDTVSAPESESVVFPAENDKKETEFGGPNSSLPAFKSGVYNDSGLSRLLTKSSSVKSAGRTSSPEPPVRQGSYNDGGLSSLIAQATRKPSQYKPVNKARPKSEHASRASMNLRDLFDGLEAEIDYFNAGDDIETSKAGGGDEGKDIAQMEKELDGLVAKGVDLFN